MQKQTAVTNLKELRLKMADKFAALENGEITIGEAKAFTGIATVIVNSVKVEFVNNQANSITSNIDFLEYENKNKNNPVVKGLKSEFFEHDKKLIG